MDEIYDDDIDNDNAYLALLEAKILNSPDTEEISNALHRMLLKLIERQQNQFELHGNPLCAWIAYLHARQADVAIPAWVQEYLDRCARGMWELLEQSISGKKIDHAMVAKAIDFAGQRGKGTAFTAYGSPRWMFLAELVILHMRKGAQETYAFKEVAKRNSTSESTVRRAWQRYQADYPERVKERLSSTKHPIS